MQTLKIKVDDITEDDILDLMTFLDSGVLPHNRTESGLAMLYGRLRARGNKIDKAEERLDKDRKKKQESYKWKIINDIKQGLEDMKNENGGGYNPYKYEIANIKSWADGKTLLIGFRDVDENGKTKRRHSILIEEVYNPDFFQEMMQKYAPQEDLHDKPF